MIFPCNEAGKNVEAHVAMSPGLSLFRREEPVDGDRDESYALHSYRSMATCHIGMAAFPTKMTNVMAAFPTKMTNVVHNRATTVFYTEIAGSLI